jgi:hypothetical protein
MIRTNSCTLFFILITLASGCSTKSDIHAQRSIVDSTIKANQENFLHCFANQGSKVEGKMRIWFIIETDGMVKSVSLKESTLDNPIIEQCMMKEIMGLKFNTFSKKKIEIVYPFKFARTSND